MDSSELDSKFTYHAPHGDQTSRYEQVRSGGRELAKLINVLCPDSHEKDLAVDRLREVIMWANAAIACNE